MAQPNPLRSGLIGPDVGLVPAVQAVRVRPGAINAPALVIHQPHLPSFMRIRLPDQSSTGFGLGSAKLFGSATGEFIERYSAGVAPEYHDDPPSSARIPAREFRQFSEAQYASPDFPYVHPDSLEELRYVTAYRSTDNSAVAVPADLVYLSPSGEIPWCTITSSGLASGRNYGMAARAAVFELIERDAFMRSWYQEIQGECLEIPENIPQHFSPELRGICRQLTILGVKVTLVRLSGVGGTPVVLSCARSAEVGLAVGCSAKASIKEAMVAAFIESVHTHNWARQIPQRPLPASSVQTLEEHIGFHAQLVNREFNLFLDSGPRVSESEFVRNGEMGLPEALAAAERAGWEIFLADLRSSDVAANGWHVIRALSPQAATLDVNQPHLGQHPAARHHHPHPFP
ncbi:YcaO-like family protein [Psychromicrobium sp. YIM B11713]|uniref:YcaO-like family protein n=1 Tax=Psychromicrobium sp. YIM B11713 TaxID=3145233 RepID=UPI00374F3792